MEPRKSKIVFVDHTPFVGGAQISLLNHLSVLNKDYFDFTLVCSTLAEENGLAEKCRQLGINYRFFNSDQLKTWNPLVIFRFWRSFYSLGKILREEKADLLVSNTVRSSILCAFWSFLRRVKSVWLVRDFTFPARLFSWLSFVPAKIIFNSQATSDYYQPFLKDKTKSKLVYVGRRPPVSDQQKALAWRNNYANQNDILIAYVGRLVSGKGPQILLAAAENLLAKGTASLKFVFVGTGAGQLGDNEAELKKIAEQKKITDKVFFTGYLPEINFLWPAVDILVVPSIEKESFASSAVEAMQAGVAVVASDIGGMSEAIKNGHSGLLVRPGDTADLAKALDGLVGDSDYRLKLASAGQKRAVTEFSLEKTNAQLEDIYKEVIFK